MAAVAEQQEPRIQGPPPRAASPATKHTVDAIVLAIALSLPTAITIWGWSYYTAPAGVRLRHPLHATLRSSDGIGLALGLVSLAAFLFLWLYPMRKGIRALAWMGSIGDWLRVHIVFGLSVPLYAAVHAGWRFEGLIGLGYLSMFVVALSGFVGRYLYTHIPRLKNGHEMSREDVARERQTLLAGISQATGRSPAEIELAMRVQEPAQSTSGLLATFVRMLKDDFARRRTVARLRRDWSQPRPGRAGVDPKALRRAVGLAKREMELLQQVRVLEATRKVFGLWHVAHRPFAVTALIAVLIHVVVAVVVAGIGFSSGAPR